LFFRDDKRLKGFDIFYYVRVRVHLSVSSQYQ